MSYHKPASVESVEKTMAALKNNGIESILVHTKEEALSAIKELIPAGASVMNGSSKSLEEIGFVDYLKSGTHPWNNLHAAIVAEADKTKQIVLRKHALLSDYYLGSVHAMSETGEFLVASNTGSQLPHIVYSSQNLLFVVGTQKIVPNLTEAMKRLEEYVVPLENEHMKQLYGMGTQVSKVVIFKKENPMIGRKVTVIFVQEPLGF